MTEGEGRRVVETGLDYDDGGGVERRRSEGRRRKWVLIGRGVSSEAGRDLTSGFVSVATQFDGLYLRKTQFHS